jgi:putative oxidoreductase
MVRPLGAARLVLQNLTREETMGFVRKCYCNWTGALVLSLVLLATRVVIGHGFYQAGSGHLDHIDNYIQFFTKLNIPFPQANAWFVAYVEKIGGALMMIGLLSRPVCFMLAIDMIVAYCTADRDAIMGLWNSQDVATFMGATPFWFLVVSLLVTAVGPGGFSIDGIIRGIMCVLFPRRKAIVEAAPAAA